MSSQGEIENAVPMGPMHHDKEEEEEVTLTTNVKSKEGERRRTAVPPSGRSETPETVLTGLGGDMKKTVLTGLLGGNTKTALTGPSDTTIYPNCKLLIQVMFLKP